MDADDILQSVLENEDDMDDEPDFDQDFLPDLLRMLDSTAFTRALPCASHIVQIIVNHALGGKSKLNAAKLVHKFRKVSYMMGKMNVLHLIRKKGLLLPKKDTITRWSSYYYMLDRMKGLREFYEENEALILGDKPNRKLTESDWNELEHVLKILKLFEIITVRLQAEQLTPSDLFAFWEELKLELADFEGELADALRSEMTIQEPALYNDVVYASVYLDPRYRVLLTTGKQQILLSNSFLSTHVNFAMISSAMNDKSKFECTLFRKTLAQTKLAEEHLTLLWKLMEPRKTITVVDEASGHAEVQSKFERLIRQKERQQMLDENNFGPSNDFLAKLIFFNGNYAKYKVHEQHTLDFWKRSEVKESFPALYQLSTLVNAVPVTQVSVERAFSIVAFILSERRCQLAEKTLNDILMIRLNKQLFEKIICIG